MEAQSPFLKAYFSERSMSSINKATILINSAESLFGFVSVLPGAFSVFRWECIKGEPLRKFLKGTEITDPKKDPPD